MQLFIANSSGQLNGHNDKIIAAYKRASETVSRLLHVEVVDVVCLPDATMVIPEIGVGGYTPNRYLTYLYIDPTADVSENEIYNTLCHELHHVKRYEGEGYGKTLFDSMIFEGLAVAFEEEVSGKDAFMPSVLGSRDDTQALIEKFKKDFGSETFDHFTWFIYDKGGQLPRWAGYEIGYYYVRQYLLKSNKKASELALEASKIFR